VPRSMPTASRCWCGAVDMPGSEICKSAMIVIPGFIFVDSWGCAG
jgi:hypothetical protein